MKDSPPRTRFFFCFFKDISFLKENTILLLLAGFKVTQTFGGWPPVGHQVRIFEDFEDEQQLDENHFGLVRRFRRKTMGKPILQQFEGILMGESLFYPSKYGHFGGNVSF